MTEKQQQLQKSFVDEEGTEDVTEEEAMQMFKDAATENMDEAREVEGITSSTLPPYKKEAVGELFSLLHHRLTASYTFSKNFTSSG